jgi:hypothetical protein
MSSTSDAWIQVWGQAVVDVTDSLLRGGADMLAMAP